MVIHEQTTRAEADGVVVGVVGGLMVTPDAVSDALTPCFVMFVCLFCLFIARVHVCCACMCACKPLLGKHLA